MNRRNFLGILAAAPAAALVPKLLAEGKETTADKSLVPVFQAALNPSPSQNLSMEELHQAFLNKWIPVKGNWHRDNGVKPGATKGAW